MLETVGLNGSQITVIVLTCIFGIALILCIWFTILDALDNATISGGVVACVVLLGFFVWCVFGWINGVKSNAAYIFEGPATYVGLQETFEDGRVTEVPLIEVQGADGVSGPQRMLSEDFRVATLEVGETIPVSCFWHHDLWNCEVK